MAQRQAKLSRLWLCNAVTLGSCCRMCPICIKMSGAFLFASPTKPIKSACSLIAQPLARAGMWIRKQPIFWPYFAKRVAITWASGGGAQLLTSMPWNPRRMKTALKKWSINPLILSRACPACSFPSWCCKNLPMVPKGLFSTTSSSASPLSWLGRTFSKNIMSQMARQGSWRMARSNTWRATF